MRLIIGIIIFVILLASAHTQADNVSLDYGFEDEASNLDSIDGSNPSSLFESQRLARSEELMAGITSRFTKGPGINSDNPAVNVNYPDFLLSEAEEAQNPQKSFPAARSVTSESIMQSTVAEGGRSMPEGTSNSLPLRPVEGNSSSMHRENNSKKAQAAIAEVCARFSESPRVYLGDPPVNITDAEFLEAGRTDVNLKLKNRINISRSSGSPDVHIYDAHVFELISPDIPQEKKSKIVVNAGDSIQRAIDDLAPGGIVEVNSGTYIESLQIDKPMTLKGVDAGGGLPIIDASRRGNAIEISADQVILEGVITINSSNDDYFPGAGVRISSSNNSSLGWIISYNNWRGIELADSSNNTIFESNISNNTYCGIELADSNNNTISKSNISKSDLGVRYYYSAGNILEKSEVRNTNTSLEFISSKYNRIQNNTFRNNSRDVVGIEGNEFADNIGINILEKERIDEVELTGDNPGEPDSSSKAKRPSGRWIPMPIYGDVYQDFAQEAAGTLVFNPPEVMVTGKGEWIDARIGRENTAKLVEGLLGKGEVKFRYIDAKTNLTYVVKLECDSGFDIQAKRPDAQILGEDPAVWLWYVTPLKEGNHTLILTVDLQLDKPPYNCKCVNLTHWPVVVKVLEQSSEEIVTDAVRSVKGIIAFLVSIFSLILMYQQLRKRNDEKSKS